MMRDGGIFAMPTMLEEGCMPRQPSETENSENQNNKETGRKPGETAPGAGSSDETTSKSMSLTTLRTMHAELVDTLENIKNNNDNKNENVRNLITNWLRHSQLEEEFILPEIKKRRIESDDMLDGEIKRDLTKILLLNIDPHRSTDTDGAAVLRVADVLIRQLVNAEEKPETGLFARVESFNIEGLDARISKRKAELERSDDLEAVIHHLDIGNSTRNTHEKEDDMINRERDSQGRFVSEDDHRYGARGSDRNGRRSGRYDDDDRRHDGRYSSGRDDDDRRGGRSYSARDDDDRSYGRRSNEDYGRDRGQGGWFGDPEGHAEASRRGWDERRSSGRDYDDDRRGGRSYSSARYDEDDRRYGRSNEDYSRDRGQGGWFGDPEGHAEASRRGWDERRSSGRDYDDDRRGGRSYSSARYDDDDRRYGRSDEGYSRDRGQGGWFGDPEGHAAAARRGWRARDDY